MTPLVLLAENKADLYTELKYRAQLREPKRQQLLVRRQQSHRLKPKHSQPNNVKCQISNFKYIPILKN